MSAIGKRFCAALTWPAPGGAIGAGYSCTAFILLAIYIWVLPVAHTIAIRYIAFFLLVVLTLWAAWRYKLKLYLPIAWPLAIYGAIALISVSYAIDPDYSFSEVRKEVGYGVLVLLLTCTWVRSAEAMSRLMLIVLVGNIIVVGYAIFDVIVTKSFLVSALVQEGSLSDVGYFSTYIIIILPFAAAYTLLLPAHSRVRRYLLISLLVMNLAALYFTGNRAAYISVIVELGLGISLYKYYSVLPVRRSIVIAGLILISILAGLFVNNMHKRGVALFSGLTTNEATLAQDPRWILWRRGIENTLDQPMTGGGFGREAFKLRNPDMVGIAREFWHGHNMFLGKGVQMGIPGIAAFLFIFVALIRLLWVPRIQYRPIKPAEVYALACMVMIAGMVMKNMTDDFFIRDNALLFWLLVGASAGALSGERKVEQASGPLVGQALQDV